MLIALYGCSDSSNNSQSIVGVWESENCIPFFYEDAQVGFVMGYFEFNSDNTFSQEDNYHDTEDCDSEEYTTDTWDGTFTIGEKVVAASGETVTIINLTYPCPAEAIDCSPETVNYVYYIEGDTLIFGAQAGESDEYALYRENIYLKID